MQAVIWSWQYGEVAVDPLQQPISRDRGCPGLVERDANDLKHGSIGARAMPTDHAGIGGLRVGDSSRCCLHVDSSHAGKTARGRSDDGRALTGPYHRVGRRVQGIWSASAVSVPVRRARATSLSFWLVVRA